LLCCAILKEQACVVVITLHPPPIINTYPNNDTTKTWHPNLKHRKSTSEAPRLICHLINSNAGAIN